MTNPSAPPVNQDALTTKWRRIRQGDDASLASASAELGVNFPAPQEGFEEDERYFYLPVTVLVRDTQHVRLERATFALGEDILVTLEPSHGFAAFDRAPAILKRRPEIPHDAQGIMYALLQATNSVATQDIEFASESLERMSDRMQGITDGIDAQGHELTTDVINDTMAELNTREALVSRIQEGQLLLARAARYLRLELSTDRAELRTQVDTLISDIQGVKEHAGFEHDKVRYLQQSVMTSLNAKQNQVVKVFTIITAVFLPPTLIATFYGMNFAVMPELSWEMGFTVTLILTLLAALLPLWYIKHRGWLR